MNETTRNEVIRLLDDATYASYTGKYRDEARRGALNQSKEEGKINVMEYVQLMDALNTQLETGSYEGCIIWRNAEANPLPDTPYNERFGDGIKRNREYAQQQAERETKGRRQRKATRALHQSQRRAK